MIAETEARKDEAGKQWPPFAPTPAIPTPIQWKMECSQRNMSVCNRRTHNTEKIMPSLHLGRGAQGVRSDARWEKILELRWQLE